jgi:LCP family protein required for cell wall assembly
MKEHNPKVRQPNLNSLNQKPQVTIQNNLQEQQRNHQQRPTGNVVRTRPQNSAGNAKTTMRTDPNGRKNKHKKKLTGKKIAIRFLLVILAVVVLLGVAAYIYKDHLENQITFISPDQNPSMKNEDGSIVSLSDVATDTTNETMPSSAGIHNILLIGIDSRSTSYSKDGTGNLADIIMIMTINENDNTIKLTSVQRDSYVYIPGYKAPQKINAAMTYGGPPLLKLVLENHLRLKLDQYAFVDMNHMEKVIDAVGGVTVNVSEAERSDPYGLNDLVKEQDAAFGSPVGSHMLTQTGEVTLDGRQAVAFARIRHIGNGDYERSQRQVEVLQDLMNRFMKLNVISKSNVLAEVLSLVSTNMTKSEIEGYALTFLPKITSAKFEYLQVPIAGYSNEGTYSDFIDGEWSIRPNWNGMIPLVQQFMFGTTYPFDPAPVIPQAPKTTPTPTPADDNTQSGGN